jgi:hypothetical protein
MLLMNEEDALARREEYPQITQIKNQISLTRNLCNLWIFFSAHR